MRRLNETNLTNDHDDAFGSAFADQALVHAIFGGSFTVPLYTLIRQRAEPSERPRVIAANNVLNALLMVAASILLAVLFAQKTE